MIFAHDASTKHHIGYTRIGRVVIGKNAFIGAGTIILPGVRIGNDSIIGAGSVVTRDIAAGSMAVGNPARVIGEVNVSTRKHRELLNNVPTYPAKGWTWDAGITDEKKRRMRDDLSARCGYVE
jgi:maltose O-acetyltransferase